jgi:transcriptional regulator with XRE-family HTH domain
LTTSYQQRLGDRLRAIRQQQGLTLQQVEEKSDGRWKAVVVGSYERGDRAVSVAKLAELAEFYGVPVDQLLPPADDPAVADADKLGPFVLDLTILHRARELEPAMLPIARFAASIQVQRGDFNGHVLTLRDEDLRSLSIVLGVTPEELLERLSSRGVLQQAA